MAAKGVLWVQRAHKEMSDVAKYIGVGISYTREVKPYQEGRNFYPFFPNVRWGMNFLLGLAPTTYQGPQPQGYPWPNRLIGFDQATELVKQDLGDGAYVSAFYNGVGGGSY